MTRKEFIEKYADVKVKFSEYYKYTFTYIGSLPDGGKISVDYGGNGDDIYRHDVSANKEETVDSLCPYSGVVVDSKGQVIDEFYEY